MTTFSCSIPCRKGFSRITSDEGEGARTMCTSSRALTCFISGSLWVKDAIWAFFFIVQVRLPTQSRRQCTNAGNDNGAQRRRQRGVLYNACVVLGKRIVHENVTVHHQHKQHSHTHTHGFTSILHAIHTCSRLRCRVGELHTARDR